MRWLLEWGPWLLGALAIAIDTALTAKQTREAAAEARDRARSVRGERGGH